MPRVGVEPTTLARYGPEPYAYSSFATAALILQFRHRKRKEPILENLNLPVLSLRV